MTAQPVGDRAGGSLGDTAGDTKGDAAGTGSVGAIRHPLNPNAFYIDNGDGSVLVTMGARSGRFTPAGKHIDGTLFEADPEMCVWVSAPRPSGHHRISRVVDMPAER